MTAAEPWVEYAIVMSQGDDALEGADDDLRADPTRVQARFVTRLLKCFRGYSSVTYAENDAMVTHYEARFQDVE